MKEEIYVEQTTNRPGFPGLRRVSWGAIFAGVFVALIIQVILTLLGVAIGAATLDPGQEQVGQGFAIGSGIWLVVTGLISLFTGACVAGRLCGGPRRTDGLLHGVVTFSVAEVAMILLLTTAGGALLGGTGALLSGAMASQQQTQSPVAQLQDEIQEMMPGAGGAGSPGGIDPQTGERVASNVAQASFWAFVAMVLGLGAAAWGGWVGTKSLPRYDHPGTTHTTAPVV